VRRFGERVRRFAGGKAICQDVNAIRRHRAAARPHAERHSKHLNSGSGIEMALQATPTLVFIARWPVVTTEAKRPHFRHGAHRLSIGERSEKLERAKRDEENGEDLGRSNHAHLNNSYLPFGT
jgi:hypothetical protein